MLQIHKTQLNTDLLGGITSELVFSVPWKQLLFLFVCLFPHLAAFCLNAARVVKSGRRFVFCVFACFLKLRYRNYSLKVTGEFSNGVHPMCASLTCPLGLEIGLNPDSTPLQNML